MKYRYQPQKFKKTIKKWFSIGNFRIIQILADFTIVTERTGILDEPLRDNIWHEEHDETSVNF